MKVRQFFQYAGAIALGSLASMAQVSAQEQESDYYQIESLTIPEGVTMEVSGMTLLSDGRMMVATRTGDVFYVTDYDKPSQAHFKLFASGLAQPLGLQELDGWIYAAQRGELTRMKDVDGDGRADRFETVCDDWEISGNYHEYNFGPRLDGEGFLWVTLNKPFGGEPYGRAHWRGWAVRVDPKTGRMYPMAAGLRSPAGLEISPWGDVFYTDNQGEWCNASKMSHLEFGDYHGHPHGHPTIELAGPPFNQFPFPVSGTFMKDMHEQNPHFKMPVVWFPYDKMGKSPSGIKWDTSGGKFGPFDGQAFVGDQHHAWIMRVDMERVNGHWQGACFRFREGFASGIIRLCWGKDQSLYAGMSNAGWGSRGNASWGLQRLAWTGKMPFEVQTMRAKPDGFELRFTQQVDREKASNIKLYRMESYTYQLESRYGGPEADKKEVAIQHAIVSPDGMSVRLKIDGMRAGYVHELLMDGLTSSSGKSLLHPEAYYTLVNLPTDQG